METDVSDRPDSGDPPDTPPRLSPAPSLGQKKLRSLLIGSMIAIVLVVLLMVILHPRARSSTTSGPFVTIGSVAPEFSIPSLTAPTPVNLDQLGIDRGRPVVLNFFASWCVPCQVETPLLARAAKTEQAKHSAIQFIGVDVADRPSGAIPFVKRSGITYPVGTDDNFEISAGLYGLDGEPDTFFIDSSGHVIGQVIGAVTHTQLASWLHRLDSGTR